ncbi:ABC transporter permease [Phytohabitans sp. ZYX-F-186]|uniref:Transport permease protein n=1 Tax=Phytohabitans maris TaxID=3071409 RepID=A0ABU0ZJQ3_9ACTN|nr:ABC transporter permease [Phytohabitans sp. ZYX-F-186]MDQ7907286.1 ABC transporter permease [Phytohabitans sp. ZYX-F-186]
MSARLDALPLGSVDGWGASLRALPGRVGTMCLVELQKIRRDRTELLFRAVQPVLWLLVFGVTFTKIKAIPTGGVPYLDYLTPGVIAQSALFVSIFYGIQIIWDRDAGILAKLMVTPTPRAALVTGKAFAAGMRALSQVVVVLVLSALLGVSLTTNPLRLLGVVAAVLLGSAFFCCLSIIIAGLVLSRDRMLGIGQAIMMPLFFASNALYPVAIMPGWLQAINHANPLSYQVEALRGLLIGSPARLWLDYAVLLGAAVAAIAVASALLTRLAK